MNSVTSPKVRALPILGHFIGKYKRKIHPMERIPARDSEAMMAHAMKRVLARAVKRKGVQGDWV